MQSSSNGFSEDIYLIIDNTEIVLSPDDSDSYFKVHEYILNYVKSGNLEKLQELHQQFQFYPAVWKELIDERDKHKDTALIWAAYKGHIKIIEWLVDECKADTTIKGDSHIDYLQNLSLGIHELVEKKDTQNIQRILERKVVDDVAPFDGHSIISHSILSKAEKCKGNLPEFERYCERLKDLCADQFPQVINSQDKDGNSLLILMIDSGYVDYLDYLMQLGADPLLKNKENQNYLDFLNLKIIHIARLEQYDKLKKMFAEHKGLSLNVSNQFGESVESLLLGSIARFVKKNDLVALDSHLMLLNFLGIYEKGQALAEVEISQQLFKMTREGDLENLKKFCAKIKNFEFLNSLFNKKDSQENTCFLTAASLGHFEVVDWLMDEFKIDKTVKNQKGQDFADMLAQAAMNFAEKKQLDKVMYIIKKYNIPFLDMKDEKGVTIEQKILDALPDISMAEEYSKYKPIIEKLSIFHQFDNDEDLADALTLEKAIVNGDLAKVKLYLNQKRLNQLSPKEQLRPVMLAVKHNKKIIYEYLIEQGAEISDVDKEVARYIHCHELMNTALDQVILENHRYCKAILNWLTHQLETNKFDADDISFCIKILKIIDNHLTNFNDKEISVFEKMDLSVLLNSLLSTIHQTKDRDILIANIKIIFAKREDMILCSGMDYCYGFNSMANTLSYEIAKEMTDISEVYNLLLAKACSDGRETPWFDPVMGTDDTILPSPKDFFRLQDNEIHLYQYIADQAIARIVAGNKLLAHIWFGTDGKVTKPVPPLSQNVLNLLKQRSPTFNELVKYTEKLDYYTQLKGPNTVFDQFEMLRNGLIAGDYAHSGSHELAGQDAFWAIAKFAEWWNHLKSIRPDVCDQIRELRHYNGGWETIGEILDILFDKKDLFNKKRKTDANYCVNVKAHMIERILGDLKLAEDLKRIQLQVKFTEHDFKEVDHATLMLWQEKITKELQEYAPKKIFFNEKGKFPDIGKWEVNFLLVKNNLVNSYSDFIDGKDKYRDTAKIIQYIFSEKNNQYLNELRSYLMQDDFDYLREHNQWSRFYAMINNDRAQTSHSFARIEEALATQLVRNSTMNEVETSKARRIVSDLYDNHSFLTCNRKYKYHLFDNNEFRYLFNFFYSIEKSQNYLKDKTDDLKSEVQVFLKK